MRHIFIINPTAGKSDASLTLIPQIQEAAKATGIMPEIVVTDHPGHARQIAAQAAADGEETHLYACGGDGTLNEVVQAAVGVPHLSVGCVPCGSGNDYVRNFVLKEPFLDMKSQLLAEPACIDAIKTPDGYCVDICAAGLDAQVAYGIPKFRRLPFCGGSMAYTLSIIETAMGRLSHPMRIEIDGEVMEGEYLLAAICNGRLYGGGYLAAPYAVLDDGLLDIVLVKKLTLLQVVDFLGAYKKGAHLPQDAVILEKYRDKMQFFRGRSVDIKVLDGDQIITTLDGECAPRMELHAENAQGQLNILLPREVLQAHPTVLREKERKLNV